MFVADILENVIGDAGPLDEARDAIIGGCFGFILSAGFLFAFFFLLIAFLAGGINDLNFTVSSAAFPFILLLGLSSLASPIVGIFMGIRGNYSFAGQIGCFGTWLGLLVAIIVGVSLFFAS